MYKDSHILKDKEGKANHTGNHKTHENGEAGYTPEDTHVEKVERYYAASHDPDHLHKYPEHEGEDKDYSEE